MFESRDRARRGWLLLGVAAAGAALCGCGQRGALYLPDRNARVVTRPAAASAPDAESSAPAAASAPK